jgi:hypothetical protein
LSYSGPFVNVAPTHSTTKNYKIANQITKTRKTSSITALTIHQSIPRHQFHNRITHHPHSPSYNSSPLLTLPPSQTLQNHLTSHISIKSNPPPLILNLLLQILSLALILNTFPFIFGFEKSRVGGVKFMHLGSGRGMYVWLSIFGVFAIFSEEGFGSSELFQNYFISLKY